MCQHLLDLFPNLKTSHFRETSEQTMQYNCIAWALGEDYRRWDPEPIGLLTGQLYWPDDVPQIATVENVLAIFVNRGYSICGNSEFELGFEKVALYVLNTQFMHVARQLDNGKWTSKLGILEDIEHELEALEGNEYGSVHKILKRPNSSYSINKS